MAERGEILEEIIADLISANRTIPVIVEGEKDVRALREIGLEGTILTVYRGNSLVNLTEEVAARYTEVIVLTDWDRTGGRIARRLALFFRSESVACDLEFRRRLIKVSGGEIRTVEALPAFRRNLRKRS